MEYIFIKRKLGNVVSTANGYSFRRILNTVYVPDGWPVTATLDLSELSLSDEECRIMVVSHNYNNIRNSRPSDEIIYRPIK